MSTTVKEDPKAKAPNDIRIGMNTRVRNVIRYSTSIMKEKRFNRSFIRHSRSSQSINSKFISTKQNN